MLRPANVVDLPILRALIREGALTGSFDRSLATESRESALFFNNLRQALASNINLDNSILNCVSSSAANHIIRTNVVQYVCHLVLQVLIQ